MTTQILHKRSLIIGAEPTTASLAVGEIGINVPDGKVFIHKSGSLGQSIETVVTTNSTTVGNLIISGTVTITSPDSALNLNADTLIATGSILLSGSIHSSLYYGDGSNLIFSTLNTSQSSDSLLIVGNIFNNYQYKQTTEFRNTDIVVSGSVTIADNNILILKPIDYEPTPVSGGLYYSSTGNMFVGF